MVRFCFFGWWLDSVFIVVCCYVYENNCVFFLLVLNGLDLSFRMPSWYICCLCNCIPISV